MIDWNDNKTIIIALLAVFLILALYIGSLPSAEHNYQSNMAPYDGIW